MHINDFSYTLPDERIAQTPPKVRGTSRLLVLDKATGAIEHKHYYNLPDYLKPGDVVVLNNTKVIKARLICRASNKKREFLLLERHGHNFDIHHWKTLCKGKIHAGETYTIGSSEITVETVLDGSLAIISCPDSLLEVSDKFGTVPLPPYMKRNATKEDIERYQTEFAKEAGSVAAPTASLNFTHKLEHKLINMGVHVVHLTLHVGIGTFLPIRTDNIEEHVMHSEYFEIPEATVKVIQEAKLNGNKIVAVGTTVTRTLEYAYQQILDQKPQNISGDADIFIYPGYKFKVTDIMLTNFHAPKTTVLMLAAAFAGWDNLKMTYNTAVKKQYTFLSYGDSMLIK
jgi:S-adenosylmethionine:tRNA ribosyltransferase-isomerase